MRPFAALAAAGLLGGWSPLVAQPPSQQTPTFSTSLVVTASLEAAAADELPATVDVVDAAEIERRQADLALDALRLVPGVAVAQSGSPGKIASLFVRGAASGQTLVLLDGVALNDPVLGGFDWSTVATEGLDRLEVARGPFSTLWGSQAMGGVIHLVTRRAGASRGSLVAEGGANDHLRIGASLAGELGPLWADFAGSLRRGDGEVANDFFDGEQGRLKLDFAVAENARLGVLLRATSAEIGLPFDFFGAPSPERRQKSDSRLLAVPFDWARPGWAIEARVSRIDADLKLDDADDPFAASDSKTEREQARVVVSRRSGNHLRVSGGVDRDRQRATTSSAFGPGLGDDRQSNRAVFGEASWSGERLRIDAGLRRDEASEFGGETTARAGVVIDMGASGRLRASWGEAFRAPALGDLFYPFFGNPDLEPERGESWELGYEVGRGAWRLRITGFDSDFENLIQYDSVLFVPVNIGRARVRGIEGSIEARWRELTLRADGTRLDAEDLVAGSPLPRRPRQSAHLVVDWARSRWRAGAALRYVGEREDQGRVKLGAYAATDLTAAVEINDRWRTFARVENVFDRNYEEVAGFPAPGRSWALGVALRAGS